MADTVGGAVLIYAPGWLERGIAMQGITVVNHSSASNAQASIATITPVNGGIQIIAIYASYVAAADTGAVAANGAVASVRDLGNIMTIKAGVSGIFQMNQPNGAWKNADGAVTVTLAAGGTNIGNLTVWYVNWPGY